MTNKVSFVDNSNGILAHYNMLAEIRLLCGGFGRLGSVTYTGTGNGAISGIESAANSVTETWSITCTGVVEGGGTFSVVGSVSGAMSNATVGIPYDNGKIKFTISDGATDFIVDDQFQVPVTQGLASIAGEEWEILRYDDVSANRELIMRGKGLTGTEQIYVGFRTYQNSTADYYNLVAAVFTGYVPSNTFDTQPGVRLSGVPAHNNRIDYWLTLNAQRIVLAMKVGTPVYEMAYVGKVFPYSRPSQYPYPVACVGMLGGAPATRFSDTSSSHTFGFRGNVPSIGLRNTDAWLQAFTTPWGNSRLTGSGANDTTTNMRETEGNYYLLPIQLHNNSNQLYGVFDGVNYISGFNNAVENTLVIGGKTYVVIQDSFRTGHSDYIAMRLD
jgi:hypothetical protein